MPVICTGGFQTASVIRRRDRARRLRRRQHRPPADRQQRPGRAVRRRPGPRRPAVHLLQQVPGQRRREPARLLRGVALPVARGDGRRDHVGVRSARLYSCATISQETRQMADDVIGETERALQEQADGTSCRASWPTASSRDPARAAREESLRHRGAAQAAQGNPGRSRSGVRAGDGRSTAPTTICTSRRWIGRRPLRPQLSARPDLSRHPEPADPESARGQPGADDARPVPAGDHPESAGRVLDSVHGARLVRPRRSTTDFVDIPLPCRATTSAPIIHLPAHRFRTRARRVDAAAGLRQPEQPLVGRARSSMAATPTRPRSCAPTSAASSASSRPDCCRSTPPPASTSAASTTTGGSAWRCSTRCSRWSTTPSATCWRTSTPTGTTIGLPHRPVDQLGADGQDPHPRMDLRDHHRAVAASGTRSVSLHLAGGGRCGHDFGGRKHP